MTKYQTGPLALYGYCLSSDLTDSSPCRRGTASLDFRFSRTNPVPPSGLTVVCYGQFHSMVTLDGVGNVETYDHIYKP